MKEELKSAFNSPYFFLAFGTMFLCLLGYSIPAWLADSMPLEFRENALQLSIGGILFGGVLLIMPFCAALTHSVSQVDDLHSSMLRWRVLRSSVRKYAVVKMASSALSAACAVGLAFALHAALWNLIALPVNPELYPSHDNFFVSWSLFHEWYTIHHALFIYVEMTLGMAFTAGIWAIAALAAAVWIPDRLLAVAVPACIYYIWQVQLPYYLFGIFVPDPATLYNDALTIQSALECILAYVIVLAVSIVTYYVGLNRRARHA